MWAQSLESCLTLCEPVDYSLPVFSVHGILQVRILEWVAMLSSRGSTPPRNLTCSLIAQLVKNWPAKKETLI